MDVAHGDWFGVEDFSAFFNTPAVGTIQVGPDGAILAVNERYCQMTGYPREELVGRPLIDLSWPEDREAHLASVMAFMRGQLPLFRAERRYRRKDGGTAWVEVTAVPVRAADGRVLRTAAIVQEITARKQAERALRESEAKYRAIVESMEQGFLLADVLYDDGGRPCDIAFRAANAAATRLCGRDYTGLRLSETNAAFAPRWLELYGRVACTGISSREQVFVPYLDTWFELCAFKIGEGSRVGVVFHDVTERMRAEAIERATASRDAFRVAFAEALRTLDDPTAIAQTAEALLGEHLGTKGLKLVVRSDGSATFEAPAGTAATWTAEDRALVGETAERTRTTIGLARAEAARTETQERLRVANERLEEADRRKNHFLAVLSHELRNPLGPIKNSLYLLERVPPGSEPASRALRVITRQVDQLARLVDDLLDVTRITRDKIDLQRRRFELHELVWRTIEDHRTVFDKVELALEIEPATHRVLVNADWNRVAQMLGNLLQNAVKFTPPGGGVKVTVASDPDRGQAVLRVSDTGVGMNAEILAGVFQPFMQADQTLDRSKGGLGLGLALVRGLAELHGGSVEARSEGENRGTELTVRLPLDAAGPDGPEPEAARPIARERRVLVIEDNVDAADSLREVLESEGHEVAVAYTGPDGIRQARELRPDVVLCDIGLPGMDGFAVARALKADERLRDTVLLALSGYALPEDVKRASEAGFEHHLAKPASPERLCAVFGSLR